MQDGYLKNFLSNVFVILNRLIPKRKNQIFFKATPVYKDNIAAVVDELLKNDTEGKYIIVLDGKGLSDYSGKDIYHVRHGSICSFWSFLRSRYVIYDNGIFGSRRVDNQISVNIWHGMPLKKIGNYIEGNNYQDTATYILASSQYFKNFMAFAFGVNENNVLVLSEPRNDYLFRYDKALLKLGINKESYGKTVIWMATYRTSKIADTGNDSTDNEYGVPLLNRKNIINLNNFLRKKNILLVIKHHSLQDIPDFEENFSNIKFITSMDIAKTKEPLYSILAEFDALITDYSSVYLNYLILNKPICFAYDDLQVYSNTRGFIVEDVSAILPGFKANTFKSLIIFFIQLLDSVDPYESERIVMNEVLNVTHDNRNSFRLLKTIGII